MSFTSLAFLPFAALLLLFYYALPRRFQWLVLLTASLIFYISWGLASLPFLLLSTLSAFAAARRMAALQQTESDRAGAKKLCRPWLWAGIALELLLWAGARLLSRGGLLSVLGASYYTFSLIAYLADVYWRKEKAEDSFPRLLLFSLYFPKLLQGPISRRRDLAGQLKEEHPFDYIGFCHGLQLLLWGYFKKLVIADRLLIAVENIFTFPNTFPGSVMLLGGILAAFQLYCDFSGCMDMARGLSQCLGLTLEKNFDHPFFSRTAAEFWRRWHITLGTWFKDYVYMPLAVSPRLIAVSKRLRERFGQRWGKAFMTAVPGMAVWLLTGLWHGTGWNYVVWGLYWGLIITCSTVFAPELKAFSKRLGIRTESDVWQLFRQLRTFFLYVFARIITVPGDLRLSWEAFRRIFTRFGPYALTDGTLLTLGLKGSELILLGFSLLLLWCVSMLQRSGSVRGKIDEAPLPLRWAVYLGAIFAVLIFGRYGPGFDAAAFVYMNY